MLMWRSTANTELNSDQFHDEITSMNMLGPNKFGVDYKWHFILCYKNPKTDVQEEKHAKG